jgi:hypothetical protein
MNKIRGFKIRLRKREILRTLRYDGRYTEIGPDIELLIQNQIENAYSLIHPSVVYITFFNKDDEFDDIKKTIVKGSKQVEDLLKKAEAFTLMAVTIGPDLEREVDNIKESDLTAAYVLDTAGSEAVEQSANFVSKILKNEASTQECSLSMRFSPGYGDWPVEASNDVFKYVDASKIDMSLSRSGILVPRKSITAVQAWVPDK